MPKSKIFSIIFSSLFLFSCSPEFYHIARKPPRIHFDKKAYRRSSLPSGVYYKILFDSSETIKNSIKNVANAIWQGALFSIIVLMIYLWDIKSVSIIGISIPISVITTFILMYFCLIFSTIFTLVIIPSVYSSFRNKFKIKKREE